MFGGDTRDGKIPAGVGGWQKWGVGVKIIDGVVKLGAVSYTHLRAHETLS
jgi:hypothetical protein